MLLIGLSGTLVLSKLDAQDDPTFTFPARYWVDAVAFGIASLEFFWRSHNANENREADRIGWMSVAFQVAGTVGFALCAQNGGNTHGRIAVIAIPSIVLYGASILMQAKIWLMPAIKDKRGVMVELLLAANALFGCAYVIAFALSPSYGDALSSYHATVFFFVLDLIYAVHVLLSIFVGTHPGIKEKAGISSDYTAMSATQSALKGQL